jgi:hypothetical protein
MSVLEGEEGGDGVHHHLNIKNWVENNLPGKHRTRLQEQGFPPVKGTISCHTNKKVDM